MVDDGIRRKQRAVLRRSAAELGEQVVAVAFAAERHLFAEIRDDAASGGDPAPQLRERQRLADGRNDRATMSAKSRITCAVSAGLTWGGSPSSAIDYVIGAFLLLTADPRLEPVSTCGNDDRIYSHSVGRHYDARTGIPHSRGHGLRKGGIHLLETASFSPVRLRSPPAWIRRIYPMIDPRIG